jgi:ARG/rhodanese/phosphatase superfamily protein
MTGKEWAASHLFRASSEIPAVPPGHRVAGWVSTITLAAEQQAGDLTVIPLCGGHPSDGPDVLLADALRRGALEVAEQGATGTVPEVLGRNLGTTDVLVLEGDTLVGCKQNRMVAWSVLIARGGTAPIRVGCMERGRWAACGRSFDAGDLMVDPHIRRRTKHETNAAVRACGVPQLDQMRAWGDVDRKLAAWKTASRSADYHAGLEAWRSELHDLAAKLRPVPGQIGILALCRGRLLGIEAVGHPETWKALSPRVLPAYVLGAESARSEPDFERIPALPPRRWLDLCARATLDARPARGLGTDVTLTTPGLSGSGLWHEGGLKHLVIFAS